MKLQKYPFEYDHSRPFMEQASDWIADVFYDILPNCGFEVRDEQIFMAFQLEKAFIDKGIIFAEAGVGTGKTLAYLLYAVCFARYSGKPAVIACADEALIEQLMKEDGDLAKLAKHLDFTIDARMSKSKDQYLCLEKLDHARFESDDEDFSDRLFDIYDSLPEFVRKPETMQSFQPYGDRRNYPDLTDAQWREIGWDVFQDCFVCNRRHRCGQTLSRDYYRKASDIIICSHDFYMQHVWTYDARKREGQLPLLPEHSSVVFDEGHLLEAAAQKALTFKLNHGHFEELLTRLLQGEIREQLAEAIERGIESSERLFEQLNRCAEHTTGSERLTIQWDHQAQKALNAFCTDVDQIEEQLVFESGMYTIDTYQLKIVEEQLDTIQQAISQFRQPIAPISWLTKDTSGLSLVIMPRKVKEVLNTYVFNGTMPIIFSSATLAIQKEFGHLAKQLGIERYLSFSVDSPYQYEEQMKAEADLLSEQADVSLKAAAVLEHIMEYNGRTLVLFSSKEQLSDFISAMKGLNIQEGLPFLVEGEQEISSLIKQFQTVETSVLCAVSLWEGLDIPGPALSQVIMWDLPFPPHDPVFNAMRADAADAFAEVDLPYMQLRVRQGAGRLIRTSTDNGKIVVMAQASQADFLQEHVFPLIPVPVILLKK